MERIEAPMSRKKIWLLVLGSLAFVLIGVWLLCKVVNHDSLFYDMDVKIVSVLCILFFGLCLIIGIWKLFDPRSGIGVMLDDEGINHPDWNSIGTIYWKDIVGLNVHKVESVNILLIYVSNPNDYIKRVRGWRRRIMKTNMAMYGTPLNISSSGLDCDFETLVKMIDKQLEVYDKAHEKAAL